jgi:tetratricopeptide (TPR) repeat protein
MKKTNHFLKLLLPLFLLIGCGVSNEEMSNLAQRMAELDGVDMSQADEDRSSELIFKIKKLEDDIGQILDKQREISEFNKLLGLKYMDYRMWIPAAESFNQAISLTPENSRLHYYRAICFGQQAKSESEFSRKQELFSASEEDYLIALRLDPRYSSAAYGWWILVEINN